MENFLKLFNLAQRMMRLSVNCISKSALDFLMEHFLKENVTKRSTE